MATISWIIFAISFILSDVTGSLLGTKLLRKKRWEGNRYMNGGDMSNMFRGTAGVHYPNFQSIPRTNFKCSEHGSGYYADVETQCQLFHVCHDGRKESFLCGTGTIFNQQILSCDYWHSTECDTAPSYNYRNAQNGGSYQSWVPPQGNPRYNNNQGADYQSYNPNAANNGNAQGCSGGTGPGQSENGQKPCCCLKNNYVAPRNFPSQ